MMIYNYISTLAFSTVPALGLAEAITLGWGKNGLFVCMSLNQSKESSWAAPGCSDGALVKLRRRTTFLVGTFGRVEASLSIKILAKENAT